MSMPEIDPELYTLLKWGLQEIADFYGVSVSYAWKQLKTQGVTMRRSGPVGVRFPEMHKEVVRLRELGMSFVAIAKRFNFSHQRASQIYALYR